MLNIGLRLPPILGEAKCLVIYGASLETLREISKWSCFHAHWQPKTRAKLERMNLVANVAAEGKTENYQLTEKGLRLLL